MTCKFCGATLNRKSDFCPECGKEIANIYVIQPENYTSLINHTKKVIKEYDRYPLMPRGDYSLNFIKNVFKFNPLFVLDDLKKSIIDMLLTETNYNYTEDELVPIFETVYIDYEEYHKERILKILINNFKSDVENLRFNYWNYMDLRPVETMIFYYSFSIFYIAKDLKNVSALFCARQALKALEQIRCEKGTNPIDGINSNGKFLKLYEFSADREIYQKLLQMIDREIEILGNEEDKLKLIELKKADKKGCYIATCIYGSYDCPPVWTLRRYRDNILSQTWYGYLFIKFYYFTSPYIVKMFGNNKVFKMLIEKPLNKIVKKLNDNGFENTPYND